MRANQVVESFRVGGFVVLRGQQQPLEILILDLSAERGKRRDARALGFEQPIEDLLKRLIHGASLTRARKKSQACSSRFFPLDVFRCGRPCIQMDPQQHVQRLQVGIPRKE